MVRSNGGVCLDMLLKILKFAKLLFIVFGVSITALFLYSSCSGGKQGAVSPAAPIEMPIPSLIKFVEFGEIRTDFSYANQALVKSSASKTTLQPGDILPAEMEEPIKSLQMTEDNLFLPITYVLSLITIAGREDIKTISEQIDFPAIEGVSSRLSGKHNVFLDLSDIDFENDGTMEGCPGNTKSLPICIRLWLDNELYLVWVIDEPYYDDDPATPENEKTIGRGRYKIAAGVMNGLDQQITVYYYEDKSSDYKKGYDGYTYGTSEAASASSDVVRVKAAKATSDTTQFETNRTNHFNTNTFFNTETSGDGTSPIRYYNMVTTSSFSDGSSTIIKSIGQYVENFDLLSVSLETNSSSELGICVKFSDKLVIDDTGCTKVHGNDIRVDDISFVSAASASPLPDTVLQNVYGGVTAKGEAYTFVVDSPSIGQIKWKNLNNGNAGAVPYTKVGNYYTVGDVGSKPLFGILIPGKYGALYSTDTPNIIFLSAIDTEITDFTSFMGKSFGVFGLAHKSEGISFILTDVKVDGTTASAASVDPAKDPTPVTDSIDLNLFEYNSVDQYLLAPPDNIAFAKRGIAFTAEFNGHASIMSENLASRGIPYGIGIGDQYHLFRYVRVGESGPDSEKIEEGVVVVTQVDENSLTIEDQIKKELVTLVPSDIWPGFLRAGKSGMIRFISPEAFIVGGNSGNPWEFDYGIGLKE